jgi:hypothetical protein
MLRPSVLRPAGFQLFFDHVCDMQRQDGKRVKFWLQKIENIHLSEV